MQCLQVVMLVFNLRLGWLLPHGLKFVLRIF